MPTAGTASSKCESKLGQATTEEGEESATDVMGYFAFSRVAASAMLVGVVNVFLLTALGTIGAFLYNIVASLVGGLHVNVTDE